MSTPVAVRARELAVPVLQPPRVRAAEALEDIARLRPDLGVLADYGQIVPAAVLDLPRSGILNVHPSLLPRHRGATPVPATIAAGDAEAGVSIIRMDAGIDTGPLVASRSWTLTGSERTPELESAAAAAGATLLAEIVGDWLDGAAQALPQGAEGATLTRPSRRDDGRLDPSQDARALERQVRANTPWPGTFVETDLGRVVVHRASVADGRPGDNAGRLVEHDGRVALGTAAGRLVFEEAQREGKRAVSGAEFLRGQPALIGTMAR
jgi:methionyl-tRNA formyltransferase